MRISRIRIENFRSLKDFEFEPEDGINLLVGENNAGKSAVLVALARTLGRATPEFELEDFYVSVPATAAVTLPTIAIDIEFRPRVGGTFSTNFSADFLDEITFDKKNSQLLTFRTQASYSQIEDRIATEYFSVRSDGSTLPMHSTKRFRLRGYVPFIW